MPRILAVLLVSIAPVCMAEVMVDNALTQRTGDEIPLGGFSLAVIRGDSFFFQGDLELVDFTIGSETLVFATDFGDHLTNETVSAFPTVVPGIGSKMDIPLGESYVGFAVREPVENEPFHTIGWAKLLRTNDTLRVLENAAEFNVSSLSPSNGIVVGVPEPISNACGFLAIVACVGFARRRRLNLAESPEYC